MMKRVFDVFVASAGLLLLSPLFLILSLICGFYVQERVGRGGRVFRMFKFRTMHQGADKSGVLITVGGDSRITPIGHFLRKGKLDELPQLWNVLKGEMSFVGPRPEVKKYVDLYTPEQRGVLSLTPGITDLASLIYFNESELLATAADADKYYREKLVPDKIRLNLAYAAQASVVTDFVLICTTVLRSFGFRINPFKEIAREQ